MSSFVLRTSGVGASDSSRVGREGRYGADLEATAEAVGPVAGPRHAPAALRSPERGGLRRPRRRSRLGVCGARGGLVTLALVVVAWVALSVIVGRIVGPVLR